MVWLLMTLHWGHRHSFAFNANMANPNVGAANAAVALPMDVCSMPLELSVCTAGVTRDDALAKPG